MFYGVLERHYVEVCKQYENKVWNKKNGGKDMRSGESCVEINI